MKTVHRKTISRFGVILLAVTSASGHAHTVSRISCVESDHFNACSVGSYSGPCIITGLQELVRNADGTFSYLQTAATLVPAGSTQSAVVEADLHKLRCIFDAQNPKIFLCDTQENASDIWDSIYLRSSQSLPVVLIPDSMGGTPILWSNGAPLLGGLGPDGSIAQPHEEQASATLSFQVFKRSIGNEVNLSRAEGNHCKIEFEK